MSQKCRRMSQELPFLFKNYIEIGVSARAETQPARAETQPARAETQPARAESLVSIYFDD